MGTKEWNMHPMCGVYVCRCLSRTRKRSRSSGPVTSPHAPMDTSCLWALHAVGPLP
ncbi:hypothetical protein K439DRAFT_93116 [Ramaria rubella]|nr:hypothetical protein K439DRAFT_93116 [Ramaria rubella]